MRDVPVDTTQLLTMSSANARQFVHRILNRNPQPQPNITKIAAPPRYQANGSQTTTTFADESQASNGVSSQDNGAAVFVEYKRIRGRK